MLMKGVSEIKEIRIGRELHSLNNMIMRFVDSRTNKRTVDSLTGTNGWIIGYIAKHYEKDVFQKDLEKEFGITRSTASKVVDLMEKKGFIRRVSVPEDARLKKLVLTEKSMEIASMMQEDREKIEGTITKGFSDEEIHLLSSFIERIKKNISEEGNEE